MIVGVEVTGEDGVFDILKTIAPRHARNLLRATIHGVASEITKEAKARAPVGATGNLKKSIKTKRKKSPPDAPVSQVVFGEGAFYWRFVEHGRGGDHPMAAQPFLMPAREVIFSNLDSIISAQFSKKLEAAVKRELKKQAKAKK